MTQTQGNYMSVGAKDEKGAEGGQEYVSNFCRVNPKTVSSDSLVGSTGMMSTFLVGPQFTPPKKKSSMADTFIDVFAPIVWMRTSQGATDADSQSEDIRPFRLMVFLGLKTTIVLFLKPDFAMTHPFLLSLHAFL